MMIVVEMLLMKSFIHLTFVITSIAYANYSLNNM